MTELRCEYPRCGGFLTRPRIGERLEVVEIVRHSSDAPPDLAIYCCRDCGRVHSVRVEVVSRREAA